MHRLHSLLLVAISLVAGQSIWAQTHTNAWFRSTVSIPIQEKFRVDAELQHRRQNGSGNANMFDKNLAFSFRSWFHYKYREGIKLSLSPFAYFSNYRIIREKSDEMLGPDAEFRFSVAVHLQYSFRKKWFLLNKTGLDYRLYDKPGVFTIRGRNQTGFRYELTQNIHFGIFDELLLNVAAEKSFHLFDHNRISLYGAFRISNTMKVETGYMHVMRLPGNSIFKGYENVFFFNLTCEVNR